MDTALQRRDLIIGPENPPFPTPYCSSTKDKWATVPVPTTPCPPSTQNEKAELKAKKCNLKYNFKSKHQNQTQR